MTSALSSSLSLVEPAVTGSDEAPRAAFGPRWWADAQWISLLRRPGTPAAHAFTSEMAGLIEPFLDRRRPLGKAGRKTHQDLVGVILGGILRGLLRGYAVRAKQGHSGSSWPAKVPGQEAFWSKVRAMEHAGLVAVMDGVAFFDNGAMTGKAAAIQATRALRELVKKHGVTRASFATDWPLTEAERPSVRAEDLLICYAPRDKGSDARHRVNFPRSQARAVELRRLALERLNAHLSTAMLTGCQPPVLQAQYFGDLHLGGRLYAVGAEPYQQVPRVERHAMRLNGQAIMEVDVAGSQLAVFLAVRRLNVPRDPYTEGVLRCVPRVAVKAWIAQCLNSDGPPKRWSGDHPADVRAVPIKTVKEAVLATYPDLAEPTRFLPAGFAHLIPIGRDGWAVGQWLTGMEADVLGRALDLLMEQGIIALPLFDAVLVAEGDAETAKTAMEQASSEVLGQTVGVRVKAPTSPS